MLQEVEQKPYWLQHSPGEHFPNPAPHRPPKLATGKLAGLSAPSSTPHDVGSGAGGGGGVKVALLGCLAVVPGCVLFDVGLASGGASASFRGADTVGAVMNTRRRRGGGAAAEARSTTSR